MRQEPAQPPESEWKFVDELKRPLWHVHGWTSRRAREGEADLSGGVQWSGEFPDPRGSLQTAYDDLEKFCAAGGVGLAGNYGIEFVECVTEDREAFRLEVCAGKCRLLAGNAAGIRRGIFHIEELMLQSGGPFLPIGVTERHPFVRSRISRCFFGPIKRPPLNRDELLDEQDYYPEEYLNRLAHEGINGLWLSIDFRDLYRSQIFPTAGRDSERRLEKLRRSVERCARYGIQLFAFAIEPTSFGSGSGQIPLDEAANHPELLGHTQGDTRFFCTGSATGLRYLEEATRSLFKAVPDLGGLINISFGERPTHCYSGSDMLLENNCPRCSQKSPAEIFAATAEAMARGMHVEAASAEMISWLYVPQIRETPGIEPATVRNILKEIAAATPESVTLQINFESQGHELQLGKERPVLDYSLAHIGPSKFFEDCARAAIGNGAAMSAKLQVGCSHEVATVPYVPVPGNIYRKYRRMRELGINTAMLCWYFGNYPSIMNRAAGRSSFEPFPEDEETFLYELATPDWGADAPTMVRAWQYFRDAYEQFPANLHFAYYGPVHDSLVWPLHLEPVDRPIAPSWQLGHDVSGDRIGECFAYFHTLPEILELSTRVADGWEKGLSLLQPLTERPLDKERRLELGVMKALGLQFRSAANVMRFYALREELPWQTPEAAEQSLRKMQDLMREEIRLGRLLANLADADSRLGFHSEAEGYKYFPAKLRWRVRLLEQLLEAGFEPVFNNLKENGALFAEYSGRTPQGPRAFCGQIKDEPGDAIVRDAAFLIEVSGSSPAKPGFAWQAAYDAHKLIFRIACPAIHPRPAPDRFSWGDGMDADRVIVLIEPRRLWPVQSFHVDVDGRLFHDDKNSHMDPGCRARVSHTSQGWEAILEIPVDILREAERAARPMRVNILRPFSLGKQSVAWMPLHPLRSRLQFGTHNSADLGWLIFQ